MISHIWTLIRDFFSEKYTWPTCSVDELRKRTRILVIDDNDFPYKVLFEKNDYNLKKWNFVENLNALEEGKFDIILLDINDVAQDEFPETQGLGLLKHLKDINPVQMIIAYSNSDWNLKYQDFFDNADAKLGKSEEFGKFKKIVDQLLVRRFSIDYYIDRIAKTSNLPQQSKIDKISRRSISKGDTKIIERFLRENNCDKATIEATLKIIKVAIEIAIAIKTLGMV